MSKTVKEGGGIPWSRGGKHVYGDDITSEGLYALEDEAVRLDGQEGKWIPYHRMQEVMMLYRDMLCERLSPSKTVEEIVEEFEDKFSHSPTNKNK